MAIVTEITSILVSGLSSYAAGFGSGLAAAVSAIFLDTTGDTLGLSITGQVVCAFAAVALAVGVTTLVFKWITSLGARK